MGIEYFLISPSARVGFDLSKGAWGMLADEAGLLPHYGNRPKPPITYSKELLQKSLDLYFTSNDPTSAYRVFDELYLEALHNVFEVFIQSFPDACIVSDASDEAFLVHDDADWLYHLASYEPSSSDLHHTTDFDLLWDLDFAYFSVGDRFDLAQEVLIMLDASSPAILPP